MCVCVYSSASAGIALLLLLLVCIKFDLVLRRTRLFFNCSTRIPLLAITAARKTTLCYYILFLNR
jgi:hypothetical protein